MEHKGIKGYVLRQKQRLRFRAQGGDFALNISDVRSRFGVKRYPKGGPQLIADQNDIGKMEKQMAATTL